MYRSAAGSNSRRASCCRFPEAGVSRPTWRQLLGNQQHSGPAGPSPATRTPPAGPRTPGSDLPGPTRAADGSQRRRADPAAPALAAAAAAEGRDSTAGCYVSLARLPPAENDRLRVGIREQFSLLAV